MCADDHAKGLSVYRDKNNLQKVDIIFSSQVNIFTIFHFTSSVILQARRGTDLIGLKSISKHPSPRGWRMLLNGHLLLISIEKCTIDK
jgi:hypothetical protein